MPRKSKSHESEIRSVNSATQTLVNKVWGFCHTLRDDGVGASEYLEQLTYLLFLKMADELGKDVPAKYSWLVLRQKSGSELSEFYTELLTNLAKEPGMIGQIFLQAKNAINKPATLSRIVNMIDQQVWTGLDTDLKGNIYEEILEKTASDKKSGAGQYFTPRALIEVIVACVRPEPGKTICDPASGTGGFLLKAYEYISKNYGRDLDADQKRFLKNRTFFGNEIVPTTRRLCLMNLYLHNIGELDGMPTISPDDSLIADSGLRFDYVITNPPFGTKSSQTITNDEGVEVKESVNYNRQDFWTSTSNKQLNFVQHIHTILKTTGHAAVVLPDNVLFEGGAGETIRRKLMETTDLHTILRLPTGIFYAQGVQANVLFFDARPASKEARTKEVWVYDYRTNIHHTLKQNPLKVSDLADFIACYHPENRRNRSETWSEMNLEGRWRKFTYAEILKRPKTNLDFKWLKDDTIDYSVIPWRLLQSAVHERIACITNAAFKLHSVGETINESLPQGENTFTGMPLSQLADLSRGKTLDLAIRGKLVEQNENDEPAVLLLERIREEMSALKSRENTKNEILSISEDEIPFEIPTGWTWCRLGEICSYGECGATPFSSLNKDMWVLDLEEIEKDTGTLLARKHASEKSSTSIKHLFKRGMLLYSKLRTYLNKVLIADEDGACTTEIIPIDFAGRVEVAYMRIVLMSSYFLSYTASCDYGVKMPRVSTADMRKALIPLPPLAEQKRIVAKVDEMLAACDMLTGGVCGS